MKVINDFKFTLNVSREGYTNKKEAIACLSSAGAKAIAKDKMAFKEQTITANQFLELAVNGHTFCNLFDYDENLRCLVPTKKQYVSQKMYPVYKRGNNKGYMKLNMKCDRFFKSSQVIFIDIDYTKYDNVEEYINSLTFKPTCVYMSYSDNIYKIDVNQKNNPLYTENGILSRRFRLVYVFSEQLDKDKLNIASTVINNKIEEDTKEEIQDKCGSKVSQYFNGCYGNNEVYCNNVIYDYNDILEYNNNSNGDNVCTTYYNEIQNLDTVKSDDKVENSDKPLISYQLVNDMCRLDYDEFMHYNRPHYQYIYRVEKSEWINNEYQFTDENYFSLYYNVHALKDGQKRRKKLFERMCLRRVINPDVDADTILFDAYEDVYRFFDNSDNVITIEVLKKNVESCFKYTVEQIEEKYSSNIEYLKSKRPKMILKKGVAFNITDRNKKLKELRYTMIDEVYNPNISVKENLEFICNNVFSICEKTLYNYCKDRGISTKPTEEEIMSLYDFNLSIRKNEEILRMNGIKVSKSKLAMLVKKYSSSEEYGSTTNYNELQKMDSDNKAENVAEPIYTNVNVTLPDFPSISVNDVLLNTDNINTSTNDFTSFNIGISEYISNWSNNNINI